jgi:hypothetical protein
MAMSPGEKQVALKTGGTLKNIPENTCRKRAYNACQ